MKATEAAKSLSATEKIQYLQELQASRNQGQVVDATQIMEKPIGFRRGNVFCNLSSKTLQCTAVKSSSSVASPILRHWELTLPDGSGYAEPHLIVDPSQDLLVVLRPRSGRSLYVRLSYLIDKCVEIHSGTGLSSTTFPMARLRVSARHRSAVACI